MGHCFWVSDIRVCFFHPDFYSTTTNLVVVCLSSKHCTSAQNRKNIQCSSLKNLPKLLISVSLIAINHNEFYEVQWEDIKIRLLVSYNNETLIKNYTAISRSKLALITLRINGLPRWPYKKRAEDIWGFQVVEFGFFKSLMGLLQTHALPQKEKNNVITCAT